MSPIDKIQAIFEKYTDAYHFYMKDLRDGREYELGVKQRFPICSCFKLAVLMAYFDSIKNESELFEEVTIAPEKFSPGGGVINYFTTPVKFTYFQLAQMMMAFSDGTATDVLVEKVGFDRINDFLALDSSEHSKLDLNLGQMVRFFNSSLRKFNANQFEEYRSAIGKLEQRGSCDAKTLADLALRSYQFLPKDSRYQSVLKTKKYAPRTNLFFGQELELIGKTGSIGFGYAVNDCGVIEHRGEKIALVAYSSKGWRLARELVETYCGLIGLDICEALSIPSGNTRLSNESRRLLEVK